MGNRRTWIKICGLTLPEDVRYVNEAEIDYAGFVLFYEKSKRNNSILQAKKLLSLLSDQIRSVAVVVSPTIEQIRRIEEAGFDRIQIHGELPPEVRKAAHLPVWKAFNGKDMEQYEVYLGCPEVSGFVFDAVEPGSGKTFDWNLLKKLPRGEKPVFLAGGLQAENVAEAIRLLKPDGVDVSSGVEYGDKIGKDPEKIYQFVWNVRNPVAIQT